MPTVLRQFARGTEHEVLSPTQRRRYSPACRLFVGFDAFAQVPQNVVPPAVRYGEQSHGAIHIQALAQTLGEALDRIECDIIETMQLVDDDRLDQLVETEGTAGRLIIVWLVDFVDQVAAEQHVDRRRPAHEVILRNRLHSLVDKRALERRAEYGRRRRRTPEGA